jgi:hypothetical protein
MGKYCAVEIAGIAATMLLAMAASVHGTVQTLTDIHLGVDDLGLDTTADLYCSTVPSSPCTCEVRPSLRYAFEVPL